jgi:Domain of unknown function DUF11
MGEPRVSRDRLSAGAGPIAKGLRVRRVLRLFTVVSAGIVCVAALGPGAFARSAATADLDISWIGTRTQKTATDPFTVQIFLGNSGPDASHFRAHILLPSGVRLVSAGSLECTGVSDLTCADDNAGPGYSKDTFTVLVADAPGSYTLTAELTELTATDPNLANNEASLTINVVAAAPSPVIRRFAIAPRKPKAGAPVKVSFAVADAGTGAAVVPSAVRCAAVAAGVKVRGQGSGLAGRATCVFHTPKSAIDKTLRGRISATAEGKRLTRSFAVRLR